MLCVVTVSILHTSLCNYFFKEFIFANNVHICVELIFRCMKMLKLCEFNFVRLNNVEFDHWVLNARSLHPDIKV